MEQKTKRQTQDLQNVKESNEKITVEIPPENPTHDQTVSKPKAIEQKAPSSLEVAIPPEPVQSQKLPINTTIILLFIVVFLLGIIIGYLLSGPQFNPAFDVNRIPFL